MALPKPIALACVPSAHGNGAEAPVGQYDPGVHAKHVSLPVMFWKLPSGQLEQIELLMVSLAVPSGQGRHALECVAPVMGWYVAGSHGWQPSLLLRPMVSDHEPGGQSSKTEALLAPTSWQ